MIREVDVDIDLKGWRIQSVLILRIYYIQSVTPIQIHLPNFVQLIHSLGCLLPLLTNLLFGPFLCNPELDNPAQGCKGAS